MSLLTVIQPKGSLSNELLILRNSEKVVLKDIERKQISWGDVREVEVEV